ncbi:unnamed protein product [Candida verbasci]|uniref:D-lactate dehydratase n=1 Tax=Candida verbasci TaxID=1227364 RepID=A0A9W4XH46_9ASCO|nr:unnamed protein product [Candida verbasci]
MVQKVLLAVTSYYGPFYDDGAKTGLFATEAIEPFEIFRKQGFEVTIASETGKFGYDEHSLSQDFLAGEARKIYEDKNSEFNKAINNIKKASDLDASDYDIFFAAGGHGTLFDFDKAAALHEIAKITYEDKNGVVSAVCHGPVIFQNLNLADGTPLIKGKKVTGFTDKGEQEMKVVDALRKYAVPTVKQIAEEEGATYVEPQGPWDTFTVTDSKIVTGVNPQSAEKTASDAIKAYSD